MPSPESPAKRMVTSASCSVGLGLEAGGVLVAVPGGDDFEVVEDDFEVVEDDFEVVDETPKPAKKDSKSRLAATRSPRSGARDDDEDVRPSKKRKVVADYEDDDDEDDEDEDY